jgi:hypothetical protein
MDCSPVVARCEAAEVFESVEASFNAVSLFPSGDDRLAVFGLEVMLHS